MAHVLPTNRGEINAMINMYCSQPLGGDSEALGSLLESFHVGRLKSVVLTVRPRLFTHAHVDGKSGKISSQQNSIAIFSLGTGVVEDLI